MAFEQRDMSGSLFRSKRKEPDNPAHEKFADFDGSALINGTEFWVNAWVKTSKDGTKYFSMSFKPKEARGQQQRAPQGAQGGGYGQQQPQRGGGQQQVGAGPNVGGKWRDKPGDPDDSIPF